MQSGDIMTGVGQSRPMPADPRKTDLEMFYELLPAIVGGYAGRTVDARSANASALIMTREMIGQCALLGICRLETQCLDGLPLALMPAQHAPNPNISQPAQQQGAVPFAPGQYPNQPGSGMAASGTVQGQGGMVSQQPMYANGGAAPRGDGSKGVLVAMYPNGGAMPPGV